MSTHANTDDYELAKFAEMAESWWDEDGDLKTLHHINPTRLRYISDQIDLVNQKILDIGCGGGILTEAMADAGGIITGIDANSSAINIAKIHRGNKTPAIDYVTTTAEEYSSEHPGKFDLITCMELLEHVPDIDSLLQSCSTLLKPHGHIFLSTINRTLKSYTSAIIAAEYILNLLPRGTHDYGKFIKPAELAHSLRQCNFKVIDISGMSYIPGINQATLTRDPAVNYLISAQKLS